MSGELCDAVTGHSGGAEMLAGIERSNLFSSRSTARGAGIAITSCSANLFVRSWSSRHRRWFAGFTGGASLWCQSHGEIDDAITHMRAVAWVSTLA
jgi:ATP/maltotriose-dependent transcriptional regulator MalT